MSDVAENAEEKVGSTEVTATAESETKASETEAPKKKRQQRQGKKPSAKKPEVFSDSLGERFPNLAAKFQRSRDDRIKKQIREAQADPKVQEASAKFAAK